MIKKIFCKHNYKLVANYTDKENEIDVMFYECQKCKKRKVTFNRKIYLKEWYLDRINMWIEHNYKLTSQDISWQQSNIGYLEKCLQLS